MSDPPKNDFDDFLNDLLPDLDRSYANTRVSLTERPLRAAIFVVEHCIVEIEGGTKEDFHNSPWFAGLYKDVERWFERRYGSLAKHSSTGHLIAAVQVYDRWFLLRVPIPFVTPVQTDNTVWAFLPSKVRDEENPFEWFLEGPNTEAMGASARTRTAARIEKIVGFVRKINLNLWSSFPEPDQIEMAKHVRSHISTAADLFCKNTAAEAQLAIWEVFLGVEKTFKLWLKQKGIPHEEDHNLQRQSQLIKNENSVPLIKHSTLSKLPSGTDAVKYRYAELPAPTNERQREIYELGLQCILQVSDALERKYQFFDAGFKIAQPPWQK